MNMLLSDRGRGLADEWRSTGGDPVECACHCVDVAASVVRRSADLLWSQAFRWLGRIDRGGDRFGARRIERNAEAAKSEDALVVEEELLGMQRTVSEPDEPDRRQGTPSLSGNCQSLLAV